MEQQAMDNPEQRLVITAIETQKRRETRRSIFINDAFAFGVSEEIYVKYALYAGRELNRELIDEVLREDELYRAKQYVLQHLTARMRSRREIEAKLREKEFSAETIQRTLAFLAEYGFVNDAAFARAFVNDQLLRRPIGRRKLDAELRRKGIGKESADQLLKTIIPHETELENAMAAAEKKAPTIRKSDPRKWEQAMASFLAGRGFGWDVIGAVIETFRKRRGAAGEQNNIEEEI